MIFFQSFKVITFSKDNFSYKFFLINFEPKAPTGPFFNIGISEEKFLWGGVYNICNKNNLPRRVRKNLHGKSKGIIFVKKKCDTFFGTDIMPMFKNLKILNFIKFKPIEILKFLSYLSVIFFNSLTYSA